MTLTLTIHRGAHEIGGSCIELAHGSGERLILDAGRPLDAPAGASGLLPATLDRSRPATVLFSHGHQDHWGLVDELPPDWRMFCGENAEKLIRLTAAFARKPIVRPFGTWTSRTPPFDVGPFRVTPFLTDHSGFDAYMLLVEAAGKRVLYSGDFRRHGRKAALVEAMMLCPPTDINVLILEGTNLGTDKPVVTEDALETEFVDLFRRTKGRVFVQWSGQNIDRTVTLYRAAKRTGRTLAIDLYTAEVLDLVAEGTGLPRAGWESLTVVITAGLRKVYRARGREDFIERMVKHGVSAAGLVDGRQVIMLRDSLVRDFAAKGVAPSPDDAFVYSMWRGYLDDPARTIARDWCAAGGAKVLHIHSSGHASAADLRAFASAVCPRMIVPVHGANWETERDGFEGLTRLADGVVMSL